jgi:hypothetical protein
LSIEQKTAAKEYLLANNSIPIYTVSIDSDSNDINELSAGIETETIECTGLSLLADYVQSNSRSIETELAHPLIAEFELYENLFKQPTDNTSPTDFWIGMQDNAQMPNLSSLALDILSVPAGSASVERLFSAAG